MVTIGCLGTTPLEEFVQSITHRAQDAFVSATTLPKSTHREKLPSPVEVLTSVYQHQTKNDLCSAFGDVALNPSCCVHREIFLKALIVQFNTTRFDLF